MNVNKEAAKDAYEFASAQMFYGEGAGTRRKLIKAAVASKEDQIPGYADAFAKALADQDWGKHAEKAQKLRKNIDRSKKLERNIRGLVNGNRTSLTTGVIIIGSVAYYAHETGYDKIAWEKAKREYKKAQRWYKIKTTKLKVV